VRAALAACGLFLPLPQDKPMGMAPTLNLILCAPS
jgi:hypothetical protein